MIILAPLVLEDVLWQSAKAAKLIHNPLWWFNSCTWQLMRERRGKEQQQKEKAGQRNHRQRGDLLSFSLSFKVMKIRSCRERHPVYEILYVKTSTHIVLLLSIPRWTISHTSCSVAERRWSFKGMLRPLNISIYDNLFLWDFWLDILPHVGAYFQLLALCQK